MGAGSLGGLLQPPLSDTVVLGSRLGFGVTRDAKPVHLRFNVRAGLAQEEWATRIGFPIGIELNFVGAKAD